MNIDRASAAALVALLSFLSHPAHANVLDIPILWSARFSTYLGDLHCAYGEPDCNRCVYNVAQQFRALTQTGAHQARVKEWDWTRLERYQPANLTVPDVTAVFGTNGTHFQAIVRAPTFGDDLFLSHAETDKIDDSGIRPNEHAAVFGVAAGSDSNGRMTDGPLRHIYKGFLGHPGGMQAIGSKLVVADYNTQAELQILDIDRIPAHAKRITALDLHEMASVGIARVAGGGYLLVANVDSYENNYRILYTNSLDNPVLEYAYHGKVQSTWDTGWHRTPKQGGYENLSIVTECGTGKNYVVGATGKGVTYSFGDGVWSLFELVPGPHGPSLRHVMNNTRHMNAPECDPRAGGSAFAGEHGELALYCGQKLQNTNERKELAACGFSFAGFFPGIGEWFCGKSLTPDTRMRYTEYWPNGGTPEAPPLNARTLTVQVSGHGYYSEGMPAGLFDLYSGLSCIAEDGYSKTCTWQLGHNAEVTLVPYFHAGYESVNWSDARCSPRNLQAENGMAAECNLVLDRDLAVSLHAARLL